MGSRLCGAELNLAAVLSEGADPESKTANAEAVIVLIDEVLANDPANARALALRGRAHAHFDRFDLAEADLEASLAQEESPTTREWLCDLLVDHGHLERAAAIARALADTHADILARVEQRRGATVSAVNAYGRCIGSSSERARVERSRYERALLAIAAARHEHALDDLDQCVASLAEAPLPRPPHGADDARRKRVQDGAYLARGRALFALGRHNEAIASWKLLDGSAQVKALIAEAESKRALSVRRPPRVTDDDDD